MCWVAVDRGIRLAEHRSFPYPAERWRTTRDDIYRDIMTTFWDPRRGTFVQHRGTTAVDASSLLMPMVKFISPTDPRWLSTLREIEQDLVDDSLVFRYRVRGAASDGLLGDEGTFTMCSFWYIEVLARGGDPQKARFLFDKMLGYANHLGLYAEELGPHGERATLRCGTVEGRCRKSRTTCSKPASRTALRSRSGGLAAAGRSRSRVTRIRRRTGRGAAVRHHSRRT